MVLFMEWLIFMLVAVGVISWIWVTTNPKFRIRLANNNSLQFSDSFITITFGLGKDCNGLRTLTQIPFKLVNNTSAPITIEWDSSTFVNPSKESCRVIHAGVKLIDKNATQAPSIVASQSKIDDILMPSTNIYWRAGSGNTSGGWETKPLLMRWKKNDEFTFKILLGLKIDGQFKPYEFEFKAVNIKKSKA